MWRRGGGGSERRGDEEEKGGRESKRKEENEGRERRRERERDEGESLVCVHCEDGHSLPGPEAWVLSLPITSSLCFFPSLSDL